MQKKFILRSREEISYIHLYKNQLPFITRHVLELHYVEGIALQEICSLLGKSMTVIRNHHNRGIYLLKQYYEKEKKD